MKIDKENFEKFYFGNFCESFVQSEFYALGYEVNKPVPDVGYDLLVSNIARKMFLSEEPRQYYIQVKGRICYKNNVTFYISKDDLSKLLSEPHGYLVCVFCYPIISDGREEITEYREANPTQGDFIESYVEQLLSETEHLSLKKLSDMNVPFIGYKKEYLWFNNAQLNRLVENNFFSDYDDKKCLHFELKDSDGRTIKCPIDSDGKSIETNGLYGNNGHYAYEQEHIDYLVKCDIKDSHMFAGDIYL